MTTIVICGDEIAADSQGTGGCEGVDLGYTKLYRIGNSWFGFTGSSIEVSIFKEALEGECEGIPEDLNLHAIELPDKGKPTSWYVSKGRLLECTLSGKGFHATGSGLQYALGALEMGATAKQAVEIAKKRCPYTGGKVVVKKRGQLK